MTNIVLTSEEEDYVANARKKGWHPSIAEERDLSSGVLNLLNLRAYNERGHINVHELTSTLRLLNVENNEGHDLQF